MEEALKAYGETAESPWRASTNIERTTYQSKFGNLVGTSSECWSSTFHTKNHGRVSATTFHGSKDDSLFEIKGSRNTS